MSHTIRAVVTAKSPRGSTTASSAVSRTVSLTRTIRTTTGTINPPPSPTPVRPSTAIVGTAREPHVGCSSTLSVGASVQNALAAASPGQVVCLNAGNWAGQTITGLTPSGVVTLAAAPGAQVTMGGIQINGGTTNNLAVEGIKFTGGFQIINGATVNNIIVKYNNFQNFADYAVAGDPGTSGSVSNFDVEYNQIDHTAFCLRLAANNASNWTFSHNVCGPGIGQGGSIDDHYIQTECVDGITVDNNAFEGPFNSASLSAGAHNNVMHACGNHLVFDNNVLWHTDSRAQTLLWGDDGGVTSSEAKNNLIVEDQTCGSLCPTISMWEDNGGGTGGDSNVTFSNNTILANGGQSVSGGIFTRAGTTSMTVQNNIAVGNTGGDGDYSLNSCASCSGNVSDDGSGNMTWSPSWQTTSWTPNNGAPWNPPPPGYYMPVGLSASYGHQGTIGP